MAPTSRAAIKGLLLAQFGVIAALVPVLPLWMLAVWGGVALWYWKIVSAAWAFPSALVKFALILLSVAGIYLEYQQWLALEPMLATLVLAVVLKLVELKGRRDHWLLLLMCYFIVACRFLFEQGIADVFVAALQLLLILLAQQLLYRERGSLWGGLRLAGLMLAQALPLMLFLFLVFPRIGPLWSMPLPSASGQTGMSDTLRFGDIAELSQNGELAFRVGFGETPLPPPSQRYWRGLVLEDYQSGQWRRNDQWRFSQPPVPRVAGEAIDYTVTLEAGVHEWLYSLPLAVIERDDIRYGGAYQWLASPPLTGRLQYKVRSAPTQPLSEMDGASLRRNLRLPGTDNPRARAMGEAWAEQFAAAEDRVAAALSLFGEQAFYYTLKPPLLGRHNVDEFLFSSRQGFCEHFAASFVFLMRAAGVPSRLVVGYQGGELNAAGNYLLVHQSDAHAWAEVWLAGQGWQRVDPTSAVAPERVTSGADALLSGQRGFLDGSPLSLRRFAWASDLRLYLDSLNYAWASWVLNYDSQRQNGLLSTLMGEVSVKRMLMGLALFGALPLALVALLSFRPQWVSREPPALRYYRSASRALARKTGLVQQPGETVAAFAERVAKHGGDWAPWFEGVCRAYQSWEYRTGDDRALVELKALRRAKKFRK